MNQPIEDYIGVFGCTIYGERKSKTTQKFTDLSGDCVQMNLHEGVIPSGEWLAVQYELDKNKPLTNSGKGTNTWLTGLTKCGYCGMGISVVGGQRNGKRYINCGGRKAKFCYERTAHLTFDAIEMIVKDSLLKHLEECLTDTLEGAKIAAYDVPELKKIMKDCEVELDVQSVKWDANGEENSSSTTAAMIFGIALSFITYMFVIMYGAMIMNSVIEEKTNRIVEVIVSSCTPFQLMMGKIIGVALVGLTQFAIWVLIIGAVVGITGLSVGGVGSDGIAAVLQAVGSINITYILICFVIYFIGGYLLYASLFAGFGSAVDQASDASQFSTPIIMIMIIALYAGMACMENPNGTMAMWCSIIPFTSPIVMMVRLPYGVPFLQLALSIVLLYATAAFMIWISSRIYRTGILLYGKKHSLKEIFKWIK